RDIARDFALPARAILEQPVLVVEEFFARLDGEFEIRSLDDRIDRAGLLAHAAIDAFDHIDVVARRAPGAVVATRARFDGDRLGGADRLAEFAGDATFFAVGIAAQGVFASESRRQWSLFMRIVQRRLGLEHVAHRK